MLRRVALRPDFLFQGSPVADLFFGGEKDPAGVCARTIASGDGTRSPSGLEGGVAQDTADTEGLLIWVARQDIIGVDIRRGGFGVEAGRF